MLLLINRLEILFFLQNIEYNEIKINTKKTLIVNDYFKKDLFFISKIYSNIRCLFIFIKLIFSFKESYFFDLINSFTDIELYNKIYNEFKKNDINFDSANINKILFFKSLQENQILSKQIEEIISLIINQNSDISKTIINFIEILDLKDEIISKIKIFFNSNILNINDTKEDLLENILFNLCIENVEKNSNLFKELNIIYIEDFIKNNYQNNDNIEYIFLLDDNFLNIQKIISNLTENDYSNENFNNQNNNYQKYLTAKNIYEFRKNFLIQKLNKNFNILNIINLKEENKIDDFLEEYPKKTIDIFDLENLFQSQKIIHHDSQIKYNNLLELDLEQEKNTTNKFQLSPSSISTFLTIPYKFFIEKILKISIKEKQFDEEKNTKKGLILHKICEEFQKKIIENKTNFTKEFFYKIAKNIIYNENLRYDFFIVKCLKNCYEKICFLEENLSKENNTNVYLEMSYYYQINSDISLQATIDRIEIDSFKNVNFFDFKTSSISEVEKKEKNGLSPQIAICAYILYKNGFNIKKAGYLYIGEKIEQDKFYDENELQQMINTAQENIEKIVIFLQNYKDEDFTKISNIDNSGFNNTKISIFLRNRKIFDLNEIN